MDTRVVEQNSQPQTEREARAAMLNAIPATGIARGELAALMQMDEAALRAGLVRLQQLGLIETHDDFVRPTAFAQKAMKIFKVS